MRVNNEYLVRLISGLKVPHDFVIQLVDNICDYYSISSYCELESFYILQVTNTDGIDDG